MASAGSLHVQVDVSFNDEEMPRQTDAGEYQLPPNGLKLNAMEEISDVWSEPPPKRHLHLYVTVPGEGKAFGERCVTALGQRDITDRVSTSSKLKLCQHQSLSSNLTYHG
jgi:hypothetical protein